MLARLAVEETGLGRVDDKTIKNRLVATKTPGPEDLEVQAVSGARGMMITECAPFGVVGAITPVTNPAATIINNAICDRVGRQRGRVQRPPVGAPRVLERGRPPDQPRDRRRPAARPTSSPPSRSRPSRAPAR